MKLSCPACAAKYRIETERLNGRKARLRCKKCGESFEFAPPETSGERCPESSVLFSLESLSAAAAAPAKGETQPVRAAEDILNLGGGGAFATSLWVADAVSPPNPDEEKEEKKEARKMTPIGVASIAALSMILAASVFAAVTIARVHARPKPTAAPTATTTTASTDPTATVEEISPRPAETAKQAVETPATPSKAIAKSRTTTFVAPPPSSAEPPARPPITTVTPPAPTTTAAPPKCCAGETETACQMRLAVGATCGESRTTSSTTTNVGPFDRVAASNALSIPVGSCKRADGPRGPGHVKVTFKPNGTVSAVDVDSPYAGTSVGACVAEKYRAVTVPAFTGGALSVGKTFAIE